MDQVNGSTSQKKKQVLFSIGSYSERDKRVINKISTNGLFASATTDDASYLRPQPSRTLPKTRPVSLNFVDSSSSKYRTLPAKHTWKDGLSVEKPTCPPSSVCNTPVVEDPGPIAGKPAFPPKFINRSLPTRQLSLEPDQLRHSGRVALTIAAYEGEPRTPTRLDFLPGRLSRASSTSTASTPGEDVDSAGSRMQLQNELVATLKRSNLKKRTEDSVFKENGTAESPLETSRATEESKKSEATTEPKSVKIITPTEESENIKSTKEMERNESSVSPTESSINTATEKLEDDSSNQATSEPDKHTTEDISKAVSPNEDSKYNESIAPAKESKGEIDEVANGSVKQIAIELGKKMTFKADIEKVPEQNGIKSE